MIPEIIPFGDQAALVNFRQSIDHQVHLQVMTLMGKINDASLKGITFTIPAYCSVTIGYDPQKISYRQLKQEIKKLLNQLREQQSELSARLLDLPVCYEEEFAPDLKEIADGSGLEINKIIELHTALSYRVFMLGFLPGFPYMGILTKDLQFPRKNKPRLKVAERSVGIAGLQTGIYPVESPGGWNIIGRTPIPVFDPSAENPFLFQTGDQVQFRPIGSIEYRETRDQIQNQTFDWNSLYVPDP